MICPPVRAHGPGSGPWSSTQRRDTAIIATCVRFAAPVLMRMLRTWFAAVFSVILSSKIQYQIWS